MAEKTKVFSSKVKYDGIFNFRDFYGFCYDWLTGQLGFDLMEDMYSEKIVGDAKEIEIKWACEKKLTDYFKFESEIKFRIGGLKNVEVTQEGKKFNTNKGSVEITMGGTLVRDYQGKFEQDAFRKFLRGIYERWVISSNVEQFEGLVFSESDEFLAQAKAYLDLEGKK
ncbi:hypothetical protein K9L16_02765 [Candidatus Pacearchaeota archaeon]|nr:hypothetical protein [Candidatus Pacearchaeota archaeon]